MERATLTAILERADGTERTSGGDGDVFRTRDGHDLTLYLGRPGSAMPLPHVLSVTLTDSYACVEARERGVLYTTYEAIHGLLDSKKKGSSSGGVGF